MKILRPLKAIRAKCVECSGGSTAEVKACEAEDCPLYPYRFGHNPQRAAIGGRPVGRKAEKSQKTLTHVRFGDEKKAIRERSGLFADPAAGLEEVKT